MSALRRLSNVIGRGGGGGGDSDASDEETPHRHHHHHRHLHHHHHDKKDYTVSPTGGNMAIIISSDEEARRRRHRKRRATTADAPKEGSSRPPREIDPEFGPGKSRPHKRSSVSSSSATSSGSSIASPGGVEIQGDRRNRGESPPLTPLIRTTPPTPSPLEQARRANSQPVHRPPPPYPVTPPHRDATEYIAFSPASNMSFQDGPQKRHSASVVPRRFAPHPGAVEIGSSDSIVQEPKRMDSSSPGVQSPKTSTHGLDEKNASKPARPSGLGKYRSSVRENQYDFLKTFDTVFVVDDSASMAGEHWDQLGQALETIATIATKYDSDGIDIHFLNSPQYDRKHVTSPTTVKDLFNLVQPAGITPTGACLDRILREYLDSYADAKAAYTSSSTTPGPQPTMYASLPKPLNILVLTDGEPTDDPESVIVAAARNLDRLNAPLHQVGIQFVQIGNEEGAREALEELDDALEGVYGIRDMVDFTPFVEAPGAGVGGKVSGEMILKALLGAVNRRYDRWGNEFSK
ncbi:unnamed protein product [Tuber aestivum]|uniref:VWFA domain-containing protein n=1 Tax=Tuber aestivum TaxID=59557 RepID=A0A292PLP1_9PEZI|nr:unnamed protein product [Tuber aestivum]